jgi:hypothetical protein
MSFWLHGAPKAEIEAVASPLLQIGICSTGPDQLSGGQRQRRDRQALVRRPGVPVRRALATWTPTRNELGSRSSGCISGWARLRCSVTMTRSKR